MTTPADPHEIVSSRRFDAPPGQLFRAFSDPSHLSQWWGPAGFTNTFEIFEFVPGGGWRFVMHAPDGANYPIHKQFIEMEEPHRIYYRNLQEGHGFTMTMTFDEVGDGTRLTWRMRFDDLDEADRVKDFIAVANEQNFDRLEAYLVSMDA